MQNQEITPSEVLATSPLPTATLPIELSTLANEVDESKRIAVTTSLNDVFNKTQALLESVEQIEISSPDETDKMKLANTLRLEAKNERLAAEKLFDAKRSDVQQQMARYKTEDALYLKAKQTMQIQYKHIEEVAEYKAKFAERYEAEQKELRYAERVAKLQPYNVDLTFINLREMPDESFQAFLNQQETLRLAAIEQEKREEAARIEAEKALEEAERLRLENEKLEADRIKAEQEKARIEAEKAAEIARIEAEKKAKEEAEKEAARQAELKAAKEREEAARQREAEAAKQLAEIEAEKQKRREFEAAETARLAKLDDKGRLVEFKKQLESIEYPDCKDEKNKVAVAAARDRIGKICEYLAEQIK